MAQRGDDRFIDDLAAQGIAYVPYFPLGGFSPLQSAALNAAAASLRATPMQVALAWLLQRAPNILLIPGTSSVGHLRENLAAATLELPPETIAELDQIASRRQAPNIKEDNMQDKRIALVTGANQGIGLQVAKDLVANGFTVLVGSRNFERGEAAAKEIGAGALALQLDVTDQASIAAAAERIRKEFGRLDVLVNNAAISNTRKRPGLSLEEYAKIDPPEQRVPR